MSSDFIPRTYDGLLGWAENFVSCLTTNKVILNLDTKKLIDITVLTAKYKAAFEKSCNPESTRMETKTKSELAKELRRSIRVMVRCSLYDNPAMTPELRHAMILGEKRTWSRKGQGGTPESRPRIEAVPSRARLRFVYYDEASGRRAKPKRVRGIRYKWAILDTAPLSQEELVKTEARTSNPFTLDFDESERGKAVYLSACWEGMSGETGPWGDIIKTYIP